MTFVACLPRSRSAWLANLLTHGSSFAYHEPMRWDALWEPGRVPDFTALAKSAGTDCVSFCDTAFGAYWKPALEAHPQARVLIVWRSVREVREDWNEAVLRWPGMASLHDNGDTTLLHLEARLRELAHYCDRDKAARPTCSVSARLLDDMPVVEQIWNFCAPGRAFDRRRARMLMDLNVEAILPRYIEPGIGTAPARVKKVKVD